MINTAFRIVGVALSLALALVVGVQVKGLVAADSSTEVARPADGLPQELAAELDVLETVIPVSATTLDAVDKVLFSREQIEFASVAFLNDQEILASDNREAARLVALRPETRVTRNWSAEDRTLHFPTSVRVTEAGSVVAVDFDGINVFDLDGQFQRRMRTFYAPFSFDVSNSGEVFISPITRPTEPERPLVLEFDDEGQLVRSVPRTPDIQDWGFSFVNVSDTYVVAAFRGTPLVRVYGRPGLEQIREFHVDHPAFPELEQGGMPIRYIGGARLVDDRIYVLLHLPGVEIVEFDLTGEELARYRYADGDMKFVHYLGFDVRRTESGPRFAVVGIGGKPDSNLQELLLLQPTVASSAVSPSDGR